MDHLIPKPVTIQPGSGVFVLASTAAIDVQPDHPEVAAVGEYLAGLLRPATGYALPVQAAPQHAAPGAILLTTSGADRALGEEGYTLSIAPDGVTLRAVRPAGLFWGVQTLRQLFPPAIERGAAQAGPWTLPAGVIRDFPRFAYRGVMLDVARHFFPVADVKRYIDELAAYKINYLHLHLTDDQGWRIAIKSWPRLTEIGSQTQVGGGKGGYYTQEEYTDLVAYARSRGMTMVPEIDTPSHTNAALASYAELNCNDTAPALFTGTEVGFSSLCIDKDITYRFLDDVLGELAALTPGPYLHIGGDEAWSTPHDDYVRFIERIQPIVRRHGKQMVGWSEIPAAKLEPGAVVEYWSTKDPKQAELARSAAAQGAKIIMAPANRSYLDMQYDESSPIGLHWAAYVEVEDSYTWDPAELIEGIGENALLGIEAALWAETLKNMDDVHYLTFPRLPSLAEIAWSPKAGRSWAEFRGRLAAHSPRWEAQGIGFYRSAQVDWV